MSKGLMVLFGVGGFLLVAALVLTTIFVSTSNREIQLRNTIVNKQTDNKSEFDNMWKKISQVAQVTDAQKKALFEIFTGYAEARGKHQGGGSLANWLQEAVPNVDTSTFNNLQNLITGARDRFTMRQKELLDLKREHDNIIDMFPSNIVCSILGRQKIEVTIVTSAKTEEAFVTGKDDDVKVFGN